MKLKFLIPASVLLLGAVALGSLVQLPSIATASLPACSSTYVGVQAFDSTAKQTKTCDGYSWQPTGFSPVLSETFSQGNGAMVYPWVRIPSGSLPTIASGAAVNGSTYYGGAVFGPNQFAQAQVGVSADESVGLTVRESTTAFSGYEVVLVDDSSGTGNQIVRCWRVTGGTPTQLGTTAGSAANGTTWLRIEVTGTSVTCRYGTNGSSWTNLGPYTDTAFDAGYPGFSTSTSSTVDNFTAGNL